MIKEIDLVCQYPEPDSGVSNTHTATAIFMIDEFKVEASAEIGGNCYGKTILRSLIEEAMEQFYCEDSGNYIVVLTASDGRRIKEEFSDVSEFEDCCVAVFITSVKRESDVA